MPRGDVVGLVSRQNADGTPWEPGEGDRVCSEYFVSKKTNLPNSPDYVPSVYPKAITKKLSCAANVSSLARFERAQRRSAATELEQLAKEKEEERSFLFAQRALKAFKNDHGGYCKDSMGQTCMIVEQVVVCQPRVTHLSML